MNISPEELDGLLITHPNLAEVATFGVPDDVMGERVCVAVVPKPNATITLDDVKAHLKQAGVAIFKWPERMIDVPALPRNALGKILRAELKKRV